MSKKIKTPVLKVPKAVPLEDQPKNSGIVISITEDFSKFDEKNFDLFQKQQRLLGREIAEAMYKTLSTLMFENVHSAMQKIYRSTMIEEGDGPVQRDVRLLEWALSDWSWLDLHKQMEGKVIESPVIPELLHKLHNLTKMFQSIEYSEGTVTIEKWNSLMDEYDTLVKALDNG